MAKRKNKTLFLFYILKQQIHPKTAIKQHKLKQILKQYTTYKKKTLTFTQKHKFNTKRN